MKLLYISNIAGETAVSSFSKANVIAAKKLGIEFHLAENFDMTNEKARRNDEENYGIKTHHIDFVRTPYDLRNILAFKQVVKVIREERIDVIHCNTPIGGLIGRLAGKKCKVNNVIYQAHGFHFYSGAPTVNWLLYYTIERWLARFTDTLITINHEDYERAQRFRLRNHGKVYYVPGVGIDTSQFEPGGFQRNKKREELGLKDEDIMVISAGDLIERKNYKTSIEAIAKAKNTKLQYYICGNGPLQSKLEKLANELGVEKQIHFLGFRTDVKELLWAADIFLFTTYQEGLPRSLSEAMAAGLPCVASSIRGNTDLIDNGIGGRLYDSRDVNGFADGINELAGDSELRKRMREGNLLKIKSFDTLTVIQEIKNIYEVVKHSS